VKVNKHLDEGLLQALLDGELPPEARAGAEAHLAACAACAQELKAQRAAVERAGALLELADVPAPVARAQLQFRGRRHRTARPLVEARRALLRAAALVVGLAGVAAAAVPGSPVRAWVERVVDPAPRQHAPAPPPALTGAPERAPRAESALAGVSIRPEGGSVRVVLSGAAPELKVRARLSDGVRAAVTATGAAAGARFRTGPGRIEVVGAGAGEVTVELPRGARTAVVEVNGSVYVAKDGARLRVMAPTEEPGGEELVFRVGS
jgi:putative zinc finger protein